ncbi:MAG: hypothetical protein ABIH21_00440, partial [Patescibacteria group bacterium]
VYDSIELDKATNCGVVVATQSDEPELLDPIDQPVEQSPEAALVVRTNSIRSSSSSMVYRIDGSVRKPYLNPTIYATWEKGWKNVSQVGGTELSEYSMGAPMLPKPGVVLVKTVDSPKVYWVEEADDGSYMLQWVKTENVAKEMFGVAWADYVVDIDANLMSRYSQGDTIENPASVNTLHLLTRAQLAKRI